MSSSLRIAIVSVFALGLLLYIFRFAWMPSKYEYEWNLGLHPEGQQPYDLGIFYDLLEASSDSFGENLSPLVENSLGSGENSVYFYAGGSAYHDSTDRFYLKKFMEEGGTVCIITSNYYSSILNDFMSLNYNSRVINDSLFEVKFINGSGETYPFRYEYLGKPSITGLPVFPEEIFRVDSALEFDYRFISGFQTTFNALEIRYGKGKLLYHINPIFFTNKFMVDSVGFAHAKEFMGHVEGKKIIYDKFAPFYPNRKESQTSPLKFLFESKSLTLAWYGVLAGIILFLVFRGKRKQREIPLTPLIKNTSIEYARALGTLYHDKKKAEYLAEEIMLQFHAYNRRRYHIHPGKPGKSNAKELSAKSGVSEEKINAIYKAELSSRYNPSAPIQEIIPLYILVKEYYKLAK